MRIGSVVRSPGSRTRSSSATRARTTLRSWVSHSRRADCATHCAHAARDHRPRHPDRFARHHAVSRRPDAPRRWSAASRRKTIQFSIDDARSCSSTTCCTRAGRRGGARCADRLRAAEGDSAHRARRPRSSRVADQGGLRRKEPADCTRKACRCGCSRLTARTRSFWKLEVGHEYDQPGSRSETGGHCPPTQGPPRHRRADPREIELVLDTAEAMKEVGTRPIKKVPALRGEDRRQPVL